MLTYIEPCGWCSSSISSTYCPSIVDNSSKPCRNLSSSHVSTSLISNTDSISITTNSLSDEKSYQVSPSLIRSSFNHPNDYYTSKRIDQLHERMDEIQISSFLKFINHHLSLKKDQENLQINDLVPELSNGHVLIDLIEILSSTKLKREHGRTRFHSLTNVQYVLDYLRLRMQHVNISPHEIVSGNRKQILALLWMIMKTFDFPHFHLKDKNCFVENTLLGFGQDRSVLLKWLNHILNHALNSQQIYIHDFFLHTWNNGYYLSCILKYLIPLSLKYFTMQCFDYLKELNSPSKQRLQVCFNLSNYCFDTITIIDQMDKSDRCLFKYFTELQQNIFVILKTNQMGKLIQNNPYTKQILKTIIQTSEYSSDVINDNEQYFVCIEEEKRMTRNAMGHSISSPETLSRTRTVEKSRLFNDEQQKIIAKKINRWENQPSHSHGHYQTTKEIIDKPQELIGTVDLAEPDQTVAIIDDLDCALSTVTDGEIEQIPLSNVKYQLEEPIEQPAIEAPQIQVFVESDEETEQIRTSEKEIEQSVVIIEEQKQILSSNEKIEQSDTEIESEENDQNITTTAEPDQYAVFNANSEQPTTEELRQSEVNSSNSENKNPEQTITSDQELEQSAVAKEEQKELFSSNEKIEFLEQTTSTITVTEPFIEINGIEENNKFTNDDEPLEIQPSVTTNDRLEQLSSEEDKQNASEIVDHETSITSNGQSAEGTIELQQTKQWIDENEELNQPLAPMGKVEQSVEIKPLETPLNVAPSEKPEESLVTIVQNNSISTNGKSEELTVKESPQDKVLNEKTTVASFIPTTKKLEKPVVIGSQDPVISSGPYDTFTAAHKKPNVTTKRSVPTASSITEHSHSTTSNEQRTSSTIIVEQSEPRQVAVERPTMARSSKYSEIVSKRIPKTNNTPVQGTVSSKRPEQSTQPKKNQAISSPMMSSEKSKQSLVIVEEVNQVPLRSTIEESEQPQVSLDKQDQLSSTIEEPSSSAISNGVVTKKSPGKNKKSRRSNAKKGKAKDSSIKTVTPPPPQQQSLVTIIEDVVEEPKPNNIQLEIRSSSINNEQPPPSPPNSSTVRSRKSKKKKTTATTTTTLIEKSSSSSPPIPTTIASHRNLFVVIRESLCDRKFIAFKCVIILICFCFSILILILSHK